MHGHKSTADTGRDDGRRGRGTTGRDERDGDDPTKNEDKTSGFDGYLAAIGINNVEEKLPRAIAYY